MARRKYFKGYNGRSKARPALYDGECTGCGKTIAAGDLVCFDSRPHERSIYHEACPTVDREREPVMETYRGARDAFETTDTQTTDTQTTEDNAPVTTDTQTTESKPKTRKLTAQPGSIDAAIDARIDARIGELEAAVDEDKLRELLAKVTRGEIVIKVQMPDGEERELPGAHYFMPRLLKLLAAGLHVYLWGPPGSGKTTALMQAAKVLGVAYEMDTLDRTTPKSSILGYRTPNGEPVWTATLRRYAEGGMIIWDELDNAPSHVQTLGNSMLANGHAPAAWGTVDKHTTFMFGGTGNTPGRRTPAFPDRLDMSAAFKDRLYFMFWPLDPAIECRACGLPTPPAPAREERTCTPAEWGRWVMNTREWAAKNAPTLMVTPRATITGLVALAAGETPEEVAHGLVFRGADESLIEKALRANPLP